MSGSQKYQVKQNKSDGQEQESDDSSHMWDKKQKAVNEQMTNKQKTHLHRQRYGAYQRQVRGG